MQLKIVKMKVSKHLNLLTIESEKITIMASLLENNNTLQ
jgi:hypothetical protein